MDKNAADFIGSIPEFYDRGLGPMIFVDYADEMAQRVAALKPKRVLETAAGTGFVTRRLRDTLPAGTEIVATDLNPPMLDIARAKFRPDERVTIQQADAMALPFPDASFDAVACQFGIMFYPDKPKSYVEARRVLAPGGRYLFSVWDSHGYNPFARIAMDVMANFFPVNTPEFYRAPFASSAIDPTKEALIVAGFTDINVAVMPITKVVSDARAFARGMVFGNPVIDQIKARGGVDPDRVVDKLTEAMHAEFGADPGRMPLQAILFSAARPA